VINSLTIFAALLLVGLLLVFGLYVAARAAGRAQGREDVQQDTADRARRRGQIDADVMRMAEGELDKELGGR
jgi:hypothetical protein